MGGEKERSRSREGGEAPREAALFLFFSQEAAGRGEEAVRDEDPFAVTPENVHKTQIIDADTDMILRVLWLPIDAQGRPSPPTVHPPVVPPPPKSDVSFPTDHTSVLTPRQTFTDSVHSSVLLPSLLRPAPTTQA